MRKRIDTQLQQLKRELYDLGVAYIGGRRAGDKREIVLFEGVLLERINCNSSVVYNVKETSSDHYTEINNRLILTLILQHIKTKTPPIMISS